MPSYKQLTAQLEKLQAEIAAAREKEVAEAIAEIKAKIEEYGLTAEELGFGRRARQGGPPRRRRRCRRKYRNPKTGGNVERDAGARRRGLADKNKDRFLIE